MVYGWKTSFSIGTFLMSFYSHTKRNDIILICSYKGVFDLNLSVYACWQTSLTKHFITPASAGYIIQNTLWRMNSRSITHDRFRYYSQSNYCTFKASCLSIFYFFAWDIMIRFDFWTSRMLYFCLHLRNGRYQAPIPLDLIILTLL